MSLLPSQRFNVATYGAVVASGMTIGFAFEQSRTAAVSAVEQCKKSKNALAALDENLVCGMVAVSLLKNGYQERWGNMTQEQQIGAARDIVTKQPYKEGAKDADARRSEQEHKAVRAAQKRLVGLHRDAGIAASKGGGRAPRPPVVPDVPRDMLFASPKLSNDNEARDYFKNALAALLTTCANNRQTGVEKDVKHVAFLCESIIADAKAAIEKALA